MINPFVSVNHFFSVLVSLPFWLMADADKRKTWDNYISGCIAHKCEWEEAPYESTNYTYSIAHWYKCKHPGCNMVHLVDERTKEGIELDEKIKARLA